MKNFEISPQEMLYNWRKIQKSNYLEDKKVTICIAAICEGGKGLVVGADRMMTAPGLVLEFEHNESKIEKISDTCLVLPAGDVSYSFQVIEMLRAAIKGQEQTLSIRTIGEKLKQVFIAVHMKRMESVVLIPRGWNLEDFKTRGAKEINPEIYKEIQNQIFNFGLPPFGQSPEFIIAGIDPSGAHICRIYYGGMAGGDWIEWGDKIGWKTVGSGSLHASISLATSGHNRNSSHEETIYSVYAAKKKAEAAPGVGQKHDFAFIKDNQITFLTDTVLGKLETQRAAHEANRPEITELKKAIS